MRSPAGLSLLLLAALVVALPAQAQPTPAGLPPMQAIQPGDPAVAPVQALNEALLATLKKASTMDRQTRFEELAKVVDETFLLEPTIRVAAAGYYDKATPDQQKALQESFRRYTIAKLIDRYRVDRGQSFELVGVADDKRGKLVATNILPPGNRAKVPVTYRLQQRDGRWGIVDVLLKGSISQLAVQRNEFAPTLQAGGVEGLRRAMDEVADKLLQAEG